MVRVGETDGPAEVASKIPKTPAIVYCGDSPMTDEQFMLTADGEVMHPDIRTFPGVLSMMYGLTFMLGVKYEATVGATLDLFQRPFLRIDPEDESKSSNKWHMDGPPSKVASFISDMGSLLLKETIEELRKLSDQIEVETHYCSLSEN